MFFQAAKLLDIVKNKKINSKTKVISIASGKGGVGKSTIAANIGYTLNRMNKKVCLIDADFGLANLHLHFDIRPTATIYDYMQSTKTIEQIKITVDTNLDLFAGRSGIEAIEKTSIFVFLNMLEELKNSARYDYIILDCGAGMDENLQEVLKASDSLIGVTLREPSALTDIYAFMKLASRFLDQINIIYNQTESIEHAIHITKQLDHLVSKNVNNEQFILNIIGIISTNKTISSSARLKKLVTKEFPTSSVAKEFNVLAQAIIKGNR